MKTGRLRKRQRRGLASMKDRMSGTGLIRRADWKKKEGREESSRLHLFIRCERLGLHDA
jgi:hypothetical protein